MLITGRSPTKAAAKPLAHSAAGAPSARPATTIPSASRSTIPTTLLRVAPSAMRMPISLMRRATVYAKSPYRPTPTSAAPSAPNTPESMAISRSGTMDAST
jgi:hypothetical protein